MSEENPQLPAAVELDDGGNKLCRGSTAAGVKCQAPHTSAELFCMRHGSMAAVYDARRAKAQNRAAELLAELTGTFQKLRTYEDYALFIEKIQNLIVAGAFNSKEGSRQVTQITQMLAYANAFIKGMKEEQPKNAGAKFVVTETRVTELTWQSERELDKFLQAGDPNIQIRILDDMHREGKVKSTRKPDAPAEVVDVIPSVVPPDPPPPNLHVWDRKVIMHEKGFHIMQNRCQLCGKVSPVASKTEICPI